MTILEAMAQQATWVRVWMNILAFGALVLPVVLLAWPEARRAGLVTLLCSALAAAAATWIYAQMGYTKLLGSGHIPFWGFAVYYLWQVQGRPDVRTAPRRIMWAIMVLLSISLAFDGVDSLRWLLGERTMTYGPA